MGRAPRRAGGRRRTGRGARGGADTRADEPRPGRPPFFPPGAGLGLARRLRREPARANRSSSGQPCVKPEPLAKKGPRGGDGAGINPLPSRREVHARRPSS